jgi:hypothetical protein
MLPSASKRAPFEPPRRDIHGRRDRHARLERNVASGVRVRPRDEFRERAAEPDLVHPDDDQCGTAERGEEGGEAGREARRAVPEREVVRREATFSEEQVLWDGVMLREYPAVIP